MKSEQAVCQLCGEPMPEHKFGMNNLCEGCGHSRGWLEEKQMDVCDMGDSRSWLLEQQRKEIISLRDQIASLAAGLPTGSGLNQEMLNALEAWEKWYSEDSTEDLRDLAQSLGLNALIKARAEAAPSRPTATHERPPSEPLGHCGWMGISDPAYDTTFHQNLHGRHVSCINWCPSAPSRPTGALSRPRHAEDILMAVVAIRGMCKRVPQPGSRESESWRGRL